MAVLKVRMKIFLSLFAMTLVFGLGMVLFAETFIQEKLHEKLMEKGVVLATRAASDCVDPVITERHFEMTMMFRDLQASGDDIVYLFVLDEEGRELAHTFAGSVPADLRLANLPDLRRPYTARDLSTDRGTIHDIAVPLLQGQIGVLHLGLSDTAIRSDVNEIVKLIVVFSLAVLAAGAAVSAVFSRSITRPLVALAGAAEAFGRGEREHPVPRGGRDEIGDLSRVFTEMIENRKRSEEEREKLIIELRAAMENVKTLSGLLPICASCKKVRDDKGYWNQIDAYISEHSDAEVSHGLCPDCAQKLYPGIWDKIRNESE